MTSSAAALLLLLVLALVVCEHPGAASAQQQQEPSPCYSTLLSIFREEEEVRDISVRSVPMCPGVPTLLSISLALRMRWDLFRMETTTRWQSARANAHVKCGNDGKSENLCLIDGTKLSTSRHAILRP
jgi:hypothetical protein